MLRGPLCADNYSPRFSGHETFPLRYGWLKKAVDAVQRYENSEDGKSIFLADNAIAQFGVGKNMVASMRHWARATRVIQEESGGRPISTWLGGQIFGDNGLDPYMENPSTVWLIHWQLCSRTEKTTWFWAFSHYPAEFFERDSLTKQIEKLVQDRGWPRISASTIKNDVACFVNTYAAHPALRRGSQEDALESPLTELGLIRLSDKRNNYQFVRGCKPTLGQGVFCYAVTDFWSRHSSMDTLPYETIAHEPGSPGRVFLLDENELMDRLTDMASMPNSVYGLSETAGLKQLIRTRELSGEEMHELIKMDYGRHT